jgi:hypothetical protein
LLHASHSGLKNISGDAMAAGLQREPAGGCMLTVRSLLLSVPLLMFSAGFAPASQHDALNGTWQLVPARSQFAGEPAIQTGTVTIADRQHNIYISRNYNFDGQNVTVNYQTSTDGRENSSIHEGKAFKTKAKWDGQDLVVTSTQDGIASVERYRLNSDRTLTLTVDRPGHPTVALFFEKQ